MNHSAHHKSARSVGVLCLAGMIAVCSAASFFFREPPQTPEEVVASGDGLVVTPPRAEVSRTVPDDPQNAVIELRLTNRANAPAEIQSVRSSCGCTIADDLSKRSLRSGEAATLRVRAALPRYGEKHSNVTITSLIDGQTKQVSVPLVLRGDEPDSPYVEIIPERIELRSAGMAGTVEREFQIQTVEEDSDEPWILGVEPSLPVLKTEIVSAEKNSRRGRAVTREYRIRVISRERTGEDEALSAWLTVVGRTPASREAPRVFVRVEPVQLLTLSPSRLVFTKSEIEAGSVTRTVVITTNGDEVGNEKPVVSAEHSWISSEIVATGDAHVSLLKVQVTNPNDSSALDASLIQANLAVSLPGNGKSLLRLPVIVQR